MSFKLNPFTGEFAVVNKVTNNANVVLKNIPCNSLVSVTDWVVVDSFGVLQKAQADAFSNSNVLGLVESKPTSTTANVRVLGETGDIFSGLDVTQEYFLDEITSGSMKTTRPSGTPGFIVLKLGQPTAATRFLVLKGERIIRS